MRLLEDFLKVWFWKKAAVSEIWPSVECAACRGVVLRT